MSHHGIAFSMILAAITIMGCGDGDYDAGTVPPTGAGDIDVQTPNEIGPADGDTDVNIDLEPADGVVGDAAVGDRREQRRERIRDAVDNLDVNVDDGGVDVNVD